MAVKRSHTVEDKAPCLPGISAVTLIQDYNLTF